MLCTNALYLHLYINITMDLKGFPENSELIHENNSAAYNRGHIVTNDRDAIPYRYKKDAGKGERAVNPRVSGEDRCKPRSKEEWICFLY